MASTISNCAVTLMKWSRDMQSAYEQRAVDKIRNSRNSSYTQISHKLVRPKHHCQLHNLFYFFNFFYKRNDSIPLFFITKVPWLMKMECISVPMASMWTILLFSFCSWFDLSKSDDRNSVQVAFVLYPTPCFYRTVGYKAKYFTTYLNHSKKGPPSIRIPKRKGCIRLTSTLASGIA